MSEYLPEGKLINTPQNRAVTHSLRLLREAVKKKTIRKPFWRRVPVSVTLRTISVCSSAAYGA